MDLRGSFYFRSGQERGVLGTRFEWMICTGFHFGPSCGLALSILVDEEMVVEGVIQVERRVGLLIFLCFKVRRCSL